MHNNLEKYRSQNTHTTLNLSQNEVNFVKTRLIMISQSMYYNEDYNLLFQSKPIPYKSTLKPLNPFLDHNNILRVNGRLAVSSLPYNVLKLE